MINENDDNSTNLERTDANLPFEEILNEKQKMARKKKHYQIHVNIYRTISQRSN